MRVLDKMHMIYKFFGMFIIFAWKIIRILIFIL